MIDRVELLLMLAREAQVEGDRLFEEQMKANHAHAERLRDLWGKAEETRRILEKEMRRFSAFQREPLEKLERTLSENKKAIAHETQRQANSERPAVNPSRTQV